MADKIWELCEEITSKKSWYTKVFDDTILSKWSKEIPQNSLANFEFVIRLLKATAQGVIHDEDCMWDSTEPICDECLNELKRNVTDEPEKYGVESEELTDLFTYDDWWEGMVEDDYCECSRCNCRPPDHNLHEYISYQPNKSIDTTLHEKLQSLVNSLNSEPIDWHPGSNEMVRDLVHPSLYCYVKGVSKISHPELKIEDEVNESIRYQWLPSEFYVDLEGNTKINSYVNNLNHEKYPSSHPLLQELFSTFVPSLENVLKFGIKGRNLQVIVKIGHTVLDANTDNKKNYTGGSWHIEGMPYENIAATCIYYLHVNGITDSFLEFRKPTIINEENVDYPQSDSAYTTHHYGIEHGSHHEGHMNRYLGLVKCKEGASVTFPNTLQHRVKDFSLKEGSTSGLRTIIAFFVIDPAARIISTENVDQQQNVFSIEEAKHHRERLMLHRKYFVNQFNEEVFERPFSLCEH